jgi:hypothetical protein
MNMAYVRLFFLFLAVYPVLILGAERIKRVVITEPWKITVRLENCAENYAPESVVFYASFLTPDGLRDGVNHDLLRPKAGDDKFTFHLGPEILHGISLFPQTFESNVTIGVFQGGRWAVSEPLEIKDGIQHQVTLTLRDTKLTSYRFRLLHAETGLPVAGQAVHVVPQEETFPVGFAGMVLGPYTSDGEGWVNIPSLPEGSFLLAGDVRYRIAKKYLDLDASLRCVALPKDDWVECPVKVRIQAQDQVQNQTPLTVSFLPYGRLRIYNLTYKEKYTFFPPGSEVVFRKMRELDPDAKLQEPIEFVFRVGDTGTIISPFINSAYFRRHTRDEIEKPPSLTAGILLSGFCGASGEFPASIQKVKKAEAYWESVRKELP